MYLYCRITEFDVMITEVQSSDSYLHDVNFNALMSRNNDDRVVNLLAQVILISIHENIY